MKDKIIRLLTLWEKELGLINDIIDIDLSDGYNGSYDSLNAERERLQKCIEQIKEATNE
jgi:hypothetical protein